MGRNVPKAAAPRAENATQTEGSSIADETNPHDPDATAEGDTEDGEGVMFAQDKVRPALRGGASSIIPNAVTTIHPSPEEILERAAAQAKNSPFANDQKGVEPRRFRVENETKVLWGGSLMVLKAGKVYAENEVDLAHLAKQGVRFKQISGPPQE